MHLGRIVQAAFLSGVIGCATTPNWESIHHAEIANIRDSISFYNTEIEPLNVEMDGDAIISLLKPRLDVIRQYNPGTFPLTQEERTSLANEFADVAVVYYHRQDYESARKYMEDAISVNWNDYSLFTTLGLIHYGRNDLTAASSALQRALDLNPRNEGVHQLLEAVRSEQ